MNKKRSIRGSGILVVILTSIAFSIYAVSTFSEQEHFSILINKYEKNITKHYEKDLDEMDKFYEKVLLNIDNR